jgi:hypothetical protein
MCGRAGVVVCERVRGGRLGAVRVVGGGVRVDRGAAVLDRGEVRRGRTGRLVQPGVFVRGDLLLDRRRVSRRVDGMVEDDAVDLLMVYEVVWVVLGD